MTTALVLFLAGIFTIIGAIAGWAWRGEILRRDMPDYWRWKMHVDRDAGCEHKPIGGRNYAGGFFGTDDV